MAICPFATWKPAKRKTGGYSGGPFKIVHHTTEGPTARSAFSAYEKKNVYPHFTVDHEAIYQHTDTNEFATALSSISSRPPATNMDSVVQIEVVGFAHLPKPEAMLANVARLCRWIEAEHDVPLVWPNGYPKAATPAGKDPGGHNRDAATWDSEGGHYGHCHVPENTHWDPGYTAAEVEFLMNFDDVMFRKRVLRSGAKELEQSLPDWSNVDSTMPDHADGCCD